MQFKVVFGTIYWSGTKVGTDFLDMAREKLDLPNLPFDVFEDELSGYVYFQAVVAENLARKSGLFREHSTVHIETSRKVLEEHLETVIGVEKEDNGRVTKVVPRTVANMESIIEAWETNGFPKIWKEKE